MESDIEENKFREFETEEEERARLFPLFNSTTRTWEELTAATKCGNIMKFIISGSKVMLVIHYAVLYRCLHCQCTYLDEQGRQFTKFDTTAVSHRADQRAHFKVLLCMTTWCTGGAVWFYGL